MTFRRAKVPIPTLTEPSISETIETATRTVKVNISTPMVRSMKEATKMGSSMALGHTST